MFLKPTFSKDYYVIKITNSRTPKNRLKRSIHISLIRRWCCLRTHRHTFPKIRAFMGTECEIFLCLSINFNLPKTMKCVHCGKEITTRKRFKCLLNTRKRHNIISHSFIYSPIIDSDSPCTRFFLWHQ